eukprot:6666529-Pyramimonas_sp.AAC.1
MLQLTWVPEEPSQAAVFVVQEDRVWVSWECPGLRPGRDPSVWSERPPWLPGAGEAGVEDGVDWGWE